MTVKELSLIFSKVRDSDGGQCTPELMSDIAKEFVKASHLTKLPETVRGLAFELVDGLKIGKWDKDTTVTALFALGKTAWYSNSPDLINFSADIVGKIDDESAARQLLILIDNLKDVISIVRINDANIISDVMRKNDALWNKDPELLERVLLYLDKVDKT